MTHKELREAHKLKVYRDNNAIILGERKLGREEVLIGVIRRMFKLGYPLEHISIAADKSIDEVKRILNLK